MFFAPLTTALLTLPWLWPFTSGPLTPALPYLVSAGLAALVLALWPQDRAQGAVDVARAWWLAAGISACIALLQYFDLEAPFFPLVNTAEPGRAFGNLRQPNQLATLLMIGALAVVWLHRQKRLGSWAAGATGVLPSVSVGSASSSVTVSSGRSAFSTGFSRTR